MVDNRHFVDEERQSAGRRILEMTDNVGFGALAAGWIYDRPTDKWRYLLSTPMLKSRGPKWVYERLLRMFQKVSLPAGISPLDIYVIDPDYEMIIFPGGMTFIDNVPGITTTMTFATDIKFAEFSVSDGFAFFYRKVAPELRVKVKDTAKKFDLRVQQLLAA